MTDAVTTPSPEPIRIKRPWCVRCMSWAEYLGVACPVHWWDLSDETRAKIEANVRARHPRGGRVTHVTEQMWVTARSNARAEWAAVDRTLDLASA